ncbi:acyltransferase domain-containing protein [Paenibacillus sp. strain BS8-2]
MREADFLTEASIREINKWLALPEEPLAAVLEAAAIVREDDGLLELLLQYVVAAQMDLNEAAFSGAIKGLPAISDARKEELKNTLKERAGLFNVLVVVGLLPWTIRYYRSKGIQESVLAETMSDLFIWMTHHHAEHGGWGLDNLAWLLNHVGGRIFRLGRLQFVHKISDHDIIVMRHRESGRTVLFSEPGIHYRSDGLVNGTNGKVEADKYWTSGFHQDDGGFTGYPLIPTGLASQGLIRLSSADWEVAFRRGDPVLDMHIPEGEPMLPEACEESMKRAVAFFGEYFPEKAVKAFVCVSWLLDSQLADILPAASNITAFQRKLQLFPVLSDERETYVRVFGTETLDPSTASSDTGLRKAIIAFAANGHRLHGGGGIRMIG